MESRTRLAYGPAHLTPTFRYMDGWVSRGMENRFRGSQEKNCKLLSSWSFNLKNKTYVANKKKISFVSNFAAESCKNTFK